MTTTTVTGRAGKRAPRPSPTRAPAGYPPIAEYGVIGDQRSVALVATDGTIDWYYPERFDRPSVFASVLDRGHGGFYRITSMEPDALPKQLYLPDTNVLVTRFLCSNGVGEVQDFMPLDGGEQTIVRRVVGIRGVSTFELVVEPRFNYGRDRHRVTATREGARFTTATGALTLACTERLEIEETGVWAEFRLRAGETRTFVLSVGTGARPMSADKADEQLRATVRGWRAWLAHSTYGGRWREQVHRSALTLAVLTYAPSGAIVAAPTTSLPERLGGTRNWDYRYVWARDMAFSQYALSRLGFTHEALIANRFAQRLTSDTSPPDPAAPLQPLYRVDGDTRIAEKILTHLEGYAGASPVRVGNAAAAQLQLDIYGELIDSIYVYERLALRGHGQLIPYDGWRYIARSVYWLCDNWRRPDNGIWEARTAPQHYTHSRLMCWVALDRAIRIATQRSLPADIARWAVERDSIFHWIMKHAWSERRRAFVQHDRTDVLDASLLIMPLVRFIAPTDPRWLSTLDAISDELVRDSLVYRYNPTATNDGIDGDEGTFSMCTFWYVECLARAALISAAIDLDDELGTRT